MYSTLFQTFAIGAAIAARHVLAADLEVLTPTLVQCENATVQFSGGAPNYLVSIVPSNDSCADSILDIPQTTKTQVQFLVAIAAGTSVEVVVDSADGEEGWSAITVVQPGKDSSCLSKTAAGSSSVQASSTLPTPSGASATPAVSSTNTPGTGSSDSFSAPSPPVQSGTIDSGSDSPDAPVNVGSGPNSTTSSGAVPSAALSLGSLMASVLFVFAASRL